MDNEMIEGQGNRLRHERSPYLLQHADNPVDWYPWGDEAFEKATAEDKPIFLSIGYSTCHWCHVMAHESFEDADVARLMNETFVSIKVDREERPDIDNVYMTVCQLMTGSGGWPLTIIMTPDRKPFFAATYIPKDNRHGRIGMIELIPSINDAWKTRRGEVADVTAQVISALNQTTAVAAGGELGEQVLHDAYESLGERYDEQHGGFGTAPKFSTPHNLLFLLRYWRRTKNEKALQMVERTLQSMRQGGMYDHVGYGFHRYSTDQEWLVPHFEKMLYDQAMLAMAYIEAYQATGKKEYESTAREIFTYVLRDMTDGEGGFYSAEDADSEGVEGKFYTWKQEEFVEVLGREDAGLPINVYSIKIDGNFMDEATRSRNGTNIVHLKKSYEELAGEFGVPIEMLQIQMEKARATLFEYREKRVHPQKDDKILADWNGLMIAALAKGAQAFDDKEYKQAARKAAGFVMGRMRGSDGRLRHRYREGQVGIMANLDDYAFMVWGLIELYQATFEAAYLQQAMELNTIMMKHFPDVENGGFYFSAEDAEDMLVRQKEVADAALPSGNSVAMLNLVRLGRMTGDTELESQVAKLGRAFSTVVTRMPAAHTQLMAAVDFAVGPSHEVVIAGKTKSKDTNAMLRALSAPFIPNKVVLFRPTEQVTEITSIAPFIESYPATGNKATAYVCSNFRCQRPTTSVDEMLALLNA